jgi:hypothetical protein
MSGATSFTSLPNIDISGLRSQDLAERERVAGEIGKAAGEVGFFYVSGAGVDDTLFERMLTATKQFFGLPLEEKMRYYIGLSKCHRSYVPSGEEGLATGMPEMKEAFDTALDLPDNDADYLAGNPMLGAEHMAGAGWLRRSGERLLPGGARCRPPLAVGVRGSARKIPIRSPSTQPRRRASCASSTTRCCLRGDQPPGAQGQKNAIRSHCSSTSTTTPR